jgi:hypothetical protein
MSESTDDRLWRVRASVVTNGEWYVEAESAGEAREKFKITEGLIETDQFGKPLVELSGSTPEGGEQHG